MQIRGMDRTSTDQRHTRGIACQLDGRETAVGDAVTRGDTGDLLRQEYAQEPR